MYDMHLCPTSGSQLSAVDASNVSTVSRGSQSKTIRFNSDRVSRLSRDNLSCRRAKQYKLAIRSAATLSKTNQATDKASLPKALEKYTAHVSLQGPKQPVDVYILGASHVSRQSCTHITQLISTMKPNIVLLELCKDRVDLLVDPTMPPPQQWHSRAINFHSNFPQQSSSTATACKKLLSQLRCQPGRPFAAYDIEQDCIQLLSSGMFASVVPVTQPASLADAPMFVHDGSQVRPLLTCWITIDATCPHTAVLLVAGDFVSRGVASLMLVLSTSIASSALSISTSQKQPSPPDLCKLSACLIAILLKTTFQLVPLHLTLQVQTVAPLGSLRFQAAPRQLPPVKSITISSSTENSGSSEQILKTATEKGQQGTSTLDVLLHAHQQMQASCSSPASVSFTGIESGDIKASITAVKGPNEASITGLEGTAKLGKGWGITAFQPRSPQVPPLHSDAMSTVGSRTGRSCHGFITAA